jgi:hypothetical protein
VVGIACFCHAVPGTATESYACQSYPECARKIVSAVKVIFVVEAVENASATESANLAVVLGAAEG